MPPIYNPTGYRAGYVTPTKPAKRKAAPAGFNPRQGTNMAGSSWNNPVLQDPNYNTFTVDYADPADYGGTTDWGAMGADLASQPGWGGAAPGGRNSISLGGEPAYRGILDRFTNDWRARINAGAADMQTRRLSNARALINRLGVRDPNALLGQVGQYGLTLADLQAAANNPFSELQAIGKQATAQRGAMIADRAQRGGIRSGGSSRGVRMIEDARARQEALASQEALQGLAEQQFQQRDWERGAWDDFYQRSNELEMQLAQAYQPQEAVWDAASGGYRYGNKIYDQNGNLIRTL